MLCKHNIIQNQKVIKAFSQKSRFLYIMTIYYVNYVMLTK